MIKATKPVHPSSRCSWSLFGLVALTLSVSSCGGCGHDDAQPAPPPPSACATVPDTKSTSFYDAVSFLFKGDCTTQKNVDPAAFVRASVAVLRGRVVDDAGMPLPAVAISAPQQTKWGTTRTAADGTYAFAVQGGGKAVLRFELKDHIASQRGVSVAWNRVAVLEDVALLQPSQKTSSIDLGGGSDWQAATGDTVQDASGTRTLHVLFPPGVHATKVAADGTESPLGHGTLRLTEFTRDDRGKRSMPASLPATSAYTYASALSFDEAEGAKQVKFDVPVYAYVDNFLHMKAGAAVPVGSYRPDADAWDGGTSGVVVAAVDAGGKLGLDVDGDGQADTGAKLDALAITQGELDSLSSFAKPGDSLWRSPLRHFSSVDFNWGSSPPPGALPPLGGALGRSTPKPCRQYGGSSFECENQVLHEDLAVDGTGATLHYASDSERGFTAAFTRGIPITGDTVPPGVKRAEVDINILGQVTHTVYNAVGPHLTHTFTWDGKDGWGRVWRGLTVAEVHVALIYDAVYRTTPRFGDVPDGSSVGMGATRTESALYRAYDVPIGLWDAAIMGAGGWTLSFHHFYDPQAQILYRGDGEKRSAASISAVAEAFAGQATAGFSGDGGPATAALFRSLGGGAVLPDGSLVVSDPLDHRLRRVDSRGVISTFAGTGVEGTAGDGGPATSAQVSRPSAMTAGPDGTLCFLDGVSSDPLMPPPPIGSRIRCVAPGGEIRTVIGGGKKQRLVAREDALGTDLDLGALGAFLGSIALAADGTLYANDYVMGPNGRVTQPAPAPAIVSAGGAGYGLALTPDGSVLVTAGSQVFRKGPDGTTSLFAGSGVSGYAGDGGAATGAQFVLPSQLASGPDGSVYIWDLGLVRRVLPSGIITTFAGGTPDVTPLPVAARQFHVPAFGAMTAAPDGTLFLIPTDGGTQVVRFRAPLPSVGPDTLLVPDESGSEVYVFDGTGRHLRTLNALTESEQVRFTYDANGYLTRVEDPDANALTIDRDAAGRATTIHAPFGQATTLAYDPAGHLAKVSDALARTTTLAMDGGGLLTQLVDPNGGIHTMQYGPDGRLTQDANAAGATWSLSRAEDAAVHVTVKTGLGRSRIHDVLFTGSDEVRAVTNEDSTRTTSTRSDNGTTKLTAADGTIVTETLVADPRFGMAAPFVGSRSVTFPSGATATWSTQKTATVASDGLTPTQLQKTVTDADGTWTQIYDGSARTTTTTTPSGRSMRTGVDARGRLIDVETPGVSPIALAYDTRGRVASVKQGTRSLIVDYDPATGRPSAIHDPEGRTLSADRDAVGRVTKLVLPDGANVALAYDSDDNAVSITPPGKPAHAMVHTKDDLLASYLPPGGASTLYGYDLDRALTAITDPDGTEQQIAYDASGRPSSITFPGGTVQPVYSASTGLLSQLAGPASNTLSATYDGGLVMSVKAQGAAPGTLSWTYDAKLRIASETVGASAIAVARDADGMLTSVGQMTATRDPATGQVVTATVGAVTWTYAYTMFGELASARAATGAGPLLDFAYTYDKLSRILTKTETVGGATTTAWAYGYDLAGRLTTVTKDGAPDSAYAYDLNGNRTDNAATVDAQDRLLSGFGRSFVYTPNGSIDTSTSAAAITKYAYDGRGNLRGASLPGSHAVAYDLDALGRRISRSYDGAITKRWLYRNSLQIAAEVDATGNAVSRFVYGPTSLTAAYMERGGILYSFVTDQVGSVRNVVRATDGAVVQAITYNAWGKVLSDTSPGFQPFGFAGGIYDLATGLTHFGARDYDPSVGRWTTKDATRFAGGLNLYAYAYGDPVNFIDLTGYAPGDPYRSADAAALAALNDVVPLSRAENREYIGEIYQVGTNVYSYTAPKSGGESGARPERHLGLDVVGRYHSHGQCSSEFIEDKFSDVDLASANKSQASMNGWFSHGYWNEYLGTPGGTVLRYSPWMGAGGTTQRLQAGDSCPGEFPELCGR
jgi:RHS repeat-associated protein